MAGAPLVPMAIGAVAGGLLDKKNPLRGAALGAFGGYAAGPALAGAAGGGASAGATGLASLPASVLPASQAFGAGGGALAEGAAASAGAGGIGAAASPVGGMNFGQRLAMQGAQGLLGGRQQQQPMMAPAPGRPMQPDAGGSFAQSSPFMTAGRMPQPAGAMGLISARNRFSPFDPWSQ